MKRPSRPKASSAKQDARPSSSASSGRAAAAGADPAHRARGSRAASAPAVGCSPPARAGTDYVNGLAPDVVQAERPLNGESHYKREARRIYDNVEGGAGRGRRRHSGRGARRSVLYDRARDASLSRGASRGVRQAHPALDIEPASEVFAHRPDHRDPGHGGRSWLRPQGQARDVQAELRHFAGLGLQPRAQRRRFPLRAGTDRRSAQERRGPARSGSPSSARAVAAMADQARNQFHHQSQAQRLASKAPAQASTAWSRRRSI